MFFYTSCLTRNNNLYLKYVKDGKPQVKIQPYKPYIFVEGPGDYKTIEGKSLYKKGFDNIEELESFIAGNQKYQGLGVGHRGVKEKDFAYALLSDIFPEHIDYDLNYIKTLNIDIETSSDDGFPDVDNPTETILSIACSLTMGSERKYKIFGLQECDADHYIYCGTEENLLSAFFAFVKNAQPDIITGWNVEIFDIAYLCARTEFKYKKEWLKSFSSFGIQPKKTYIEKFKKRTSIWKIEGVSVLDYQDLYMSLTFVERESYKLDYIAYVELGERKVDYSEYKSLNNLWKSNWKKFIEYNLRDVVLVDKLVDKLRLLELVVTIAYYTRVNFDDALGKITPIETLMYNYLIRRNIVLPLKVSKEKNKPNAGGRVKSPKFGFSSWAVTLDATSLYPSIMMSLNLSPDTYAGKLDIGPDDILNRTFDNSVLNQGDYCVSANGCLFRRDKKGFTTELVEELFNTRDEYKKKMKTLKQRHGDPNLIKKYDVFQQAIKILANSVYGAFASEYFLFFNMDWAEAITLTGQVVSLSGDRAASEYLNTILKEQKDRVIFSDTDSIAIELVDLVNSIPALQTPEQKVDFIDKFTDKKITPVLDSCFNDLGSYMNLYQNRISFKREKIIEKMVITAKKRYGMLVWDDEKLRYDSPEIVVKGLEIVRSSTPEFVRTSLKESLRIILTKNEEELQRYVSHIKDEFNKISVNDIAYSMGVNELNSETIPINVRAARTYNSHLESLGLTKTYEKIKNGDKIKFIYLKMPNPLKENVVGWKDTLPSEFNVSAYIDYKTQYEKTFLSPLDKILDKINWTAERTTNLSEFF